MAQSKIIRLGLEDAVLDGRKRRRSLQEITDECNALLKGAGEKTSVSVASVKRHIATLDKASVAAAHEPKNAAANAVLAVDLAANLNVLDERLRGWLEEAERAVTPMRGVLWDPYLQQPVDPATARDHAGILAEQLADTLDVLPDAVARELRDWIRPTQVMVADWQARLGTAKELRQHAEAVANILQRVHDAEQVQNFQASVMEAVAEASPEVAAAVVEKLRSKQSITRAALLGAGT